MPSKHTFDTHLLVVDQHAFHQYQSDVITASSQQVADRWSTATDVLLSAPTIKRHFSTMDCVPLHKIQLT